MLPILNPSPVLFTFTFAVMIGVLVHDMNIDKATKVAFVPPAALATTSANAVPAIDSMVTKSEHTHVERASVGGAYSSTMPKVHPPRDDERRYIQNKKLYMGGGDDRTSVWPSV